MNKETTKSKYYTGTGRRKTAIARVRIFEGSKERLVTRWGRSDIYFMDARWHPGNYFFLLVRFYGRRRLRRMLLKPPSFAGLRADWRGEAARKMAGKPGDRRTGYTKGDKIRRYDHLG